MATEGVKGLRTCWFRALYRLA